VAVPKVPPLSAVAQLAEVLDSPEIAALVSELETTRWTGRPGYPLRSMVGMALAKSIYAVPTWTRTVALVREHSALRTAIVGRLDDVPSVCACYRFTAKLRTYGDMLARCIDSVTASLHAQLPELGRNVAIDGSDMPAYANGQRFVSKGGRERADSEFSDQDASWGHRSAVSTRKGGGFYGYKLDMAVCTATDLPVAWGVRTARDNESIHALPLIDKVRERGFAAETCAMDKGYDLTSVYDGCEARDCRPIIPLRATPAVKFGQHKPPTCEHGTWRFAGSDSKRGASKWRCPTGECKPASRWIKADRLHPADPARDAPLHRALPPPRRSRAGVRSPQERMGAVTASRPRLGSRQAARRPDDPRQAHLRAEPDAGSSRRYRLRVLRHRIDSYMYPITYGEMEPIARPSAGPCILEPLYGRQDQAQRYPLMTRVRLSGGVELWIDANLDDARKAWRQALAEAQMLEIKNDDGNVVAINPHQVLYLEQTPKPAARPANGVPEPVPQATA
jgi:hypothetical protein